jgi:Ni/Co efflux regulator RcnB
MKRIIATIVLALPLAALCVLPKSASAEPVNRDSNYDRQLVVDQRDNRSYNRDRQSNSEQRFGSRPHRQWVAAHYEKVNHHRRWVPGHYVNL